MKKTRPIAIILPFILCMLVLLTLLAGCSVSTPTLTVDGYTVSWNSVDRASGYEVNVDNVTFTTTDNEVNLITYLQKGNIASVRVRAISNNFMYGSSSYSNSISITVSEQRLSTPINFVLAQNEDEFVFSWDAVAGAQHYCLRIVDDSNQAQYFYTDDTTIDITNKLDKYGELCATVFAYADNISTLAPSEYSATIDFVNPSMLEIPTNAKIVASGRNLTYSWDPVENAVGYNVSVLNGDAYYTTSTSYTLHSAINSGEAVFLSVQAVSGDTTLRLNSAYSGVNAYYPAGSAQSYTGKNFTFGDETFDLVAESYDELETIIHFGLFYRIDNINYFVNYSGFNAGALYVEGDADRAIESYAEIKALSYNRPARTINNYGMYNLQITNYYNPIYPTGVAEGDIYNHQNQTVTPSSFTDTPRVSDYDDFKINERTRTMTVYTSDQLYYAVEYGCKPVFPEGNSPAEQAYDRAKEILREIIDDSMTDYEKTLAIYDWISFNVAYDYNLLEFVDEISISEAYNYRDFYVEGVLFDNGQAVCDGISKTFALLANIEGIECYKVTGMTSGGGHAWNKVKLDLNDDGETEWYCVDTTSTWGDLVQMDREQNIYTEYLAHTMFLVTDQFLTNNDHTETSPLTDVAVTEWDYYENTLYDGVNSLYVTNPFEAYSVVDYILTNKLDHFEIKAGGIGVSAVESELPTLKNDGYAILRMNNIYIIYRI